MPQIFIKKVLYDEIVRRGYEVNKFVEEAIWMKIKRENQEKSAEKV